MCGAFGEEDRNSRRRSACGGRQVPTAGVGMQKGLGGRGEQSPRAALPQLPPRGSQPPGLFGVKGRSPHVRALRAALWRPGRKTPAPEAMLLPAASALPPEHRSFPQATVAGAAPGDAPARARPAGGGRPRSGDPPWAGEGARPERPEGFPAPWPRSRSAPDPPLAPGLSTAGAAPAEPGDSPPAEGRAPRSPRRRPRAPLPPEPQPGLQPLKVWRHGTATGGCAGLRAARGAAAGRQRARGRSGARGSARGRGRRGGPGRAAAGDAGAFTCSGGGSRLSAARPAPKRGDGRRTHPRLRLPAPFQAGGPGAGGGQGNAAGAEQIPALEPGLREEKGCSSSLRQAKSPARAGGAGQRCQARGAPPARLSTARLDAARLGWDGHGAVRLAGGRVQGCGGARHGSARYGLARSGTAQHGRLGSVPARHGTVRFGRALRGSVTARSHNSAWPAESGWHWGLGAVRE